MRRHAGAVRAVACLLLLGCGLTQCQDTSGTSSSDSNTPRMAFNFGEGLEGLGTLLNMAAQNNPDLAQLMNVWSQLTATAAAGNNQEWNATQMLEFFIFNFKPEDIPAYIRTVDVSQYYQLWELAEWVFARAMFPPDGATITLEKNGWFELNDVMVESVKGVLNVAAAALRNDTRMRRQEYGGGRGKSESKSEDSDSDDESTDDSMSDWVKSITKWLTGTGGRIQKGNWTVNGVLSSNETQDIVEKVQKFFDQAGNSEDVWELAKNAFLMSGVHPCGNVTAPEAYKECMQLVEDRLWETLYQELYNIVQNVSAEYKAMQTDPMWRMFLQQVLNALEQMEMNNWCPIDALFQNIMNSTSSPNVMDANTMNNVTNGMNNWIETEVVTGGFAAWEAFNPFNKSVAEVLQSNVTAMKYAKVAEIFYMKGMVAMEAFGNAGWTVEELALVQQVTGMDIAELLMPTNATFDFTTFVTGFPYLIDTSTIPGLNGTNFTEIVAVTQWFQAIGSLGEAYNCSNHTFTQLLPLSDDNKMLVEGGISVAVKQARSMVTILQRETTRYDPAGPANFTAEELLLLYSALGTDFMEWYWFREVIVNGAANFFNAMPANGSSEWLLSVPQWAKEIVSMYTNNDTFDLSSLEQLWAMYLGFQNQSSVMTLAAVCGNPALDKDMAAICNQSAEFEAWFKNTDRVLQLLDQVKNGSTTLDALYDSNVTLAELIPPNNVFMIDSLGKWKIHGDVAAWIMNLTLQSKYLRQMAKAVDLAALAEMQLQSPDGIAAVKFYNSMTGTAFVDMMKRTEPMATWLNVTDMFTDGAASQAMDNLFDTDEHMLVVAYRLYPSAVQYMDLINRTMTTMAVLMDPEFLAGASVDQVASLLTDGSILELAGLPENPQLYTELATLAKFLYSVSPSWTVSDPTNGVAAALTAPMVYTDDLHQQIFGSELAKAFLASANVSPSCLGDIVYTLRALGLSSEWALRMVDAAAKVPSGLMDGRGDWVGSYDECLKINVERRQADGSVAHAFDGAYCKASYQIFNSPEVPASFQWTRVGVCVPDTCSAQDLQRLTAMLGIGHEEGSCSTESPAEREEYKEDTYTIVVIAVMSAMAGVVTFFTIIDCCCYRTYHEKSSGGKCNQPSAPKYETTAADNATYVGEDGEAKIYVDPDDIVADEKPAKTLSSLNAANLSSQPAEKKEEGGIGCKFVNTFSLFSNAEAIMSTDTRPGALEGLDCLRFLSMAWIILGHTYAFTTFFSQHTVANYFSATIMLFKEYNFQAVNGGYFAVDTFFVLSGLLATYLYLKTLKKHGFKVKHLILYYVHRIWRIVPYYLMFILAAGAFDRYLGEGPYAVGTWNSQRAGLCRTEWWKNILFINNFWPAEEGCIPWSWYLANDMQFYVIAPIIILSLHFLPVLGGILLLGALSSHIATNAYFYGNSSGSFINQDLDAFNLAYIRPYARIGSYAIGMIVGFVLHKQWHPKRVCTAVLIGTLGWIVSIGMIWLVVFLPFDEYKSIEDSYRWSPAAMAAYHSLSKIGFSCSVGWIIYALNHQAAGWLTPILTWRGWAPLSRLTFGAYLIHPLIIIWYNMYLRTPTYISNLTMVTLYPAFLCFAYAGAFVTSLVFEWPFANMEKAVLGDLRDRK